MQSELTSLSAILSPDIKGYLEFENFFKMVTFNSSVDEIYQLSKLYTLKI